MSEAKSEAKTEVAEGKSEGAKVVVAIDGSELSHRCFLAAVSLLSESGNDHITLLHIYDDAKDYLPHDVKPKALYDRYEAECIGRWTKAKYDMQWHRKEAGVATRKAVCDWVNSNGTFDVFAVGMVGRKGPKDDPTILGSTADYSLRGAHTSSLIVKSTKDIPKVATYMVGVDGSDAAHAAFQFAQRQANKTDKIMVVHVVNPTIQSECSDREKAANVSARYTEVVMSDTRATYHAVPNDRTTPVADTMGDFAYDQDVSYFVIGADGCGAFAKGDASYTLGSVSDRVVKLSKVNLIVHQSSGKVYM